MYTMFNISRKSEDRKNEHKDVGSDDRNEMNRVAKSKPRNRNNQRTNRHIATGKIPSGKWNSLHDRRKNMDTKGK